MSWRVAYSLDTLLAEINAAAPNRNKASDGSIGDAAHSSRYSDHNPNSAGVVRARDFTNDPANGCSGQKIADNVAALLGKHPALGSGAYVIWNYRIISTDRLREGWRAYTGSNPHTQHVHISVCTNAPGYDSRARWGVMGPTEAEIRDEQRQDDREALTNAIRDLNPLAQRRKRVEKIRDRLRAIRQSLR